MEAILKQNWEHSRHCEIQSLWFTNIFAAIMAAILFFIGQLGFGDQINLIPILLLAFFGLILSVVGFHIVIALSLGHQNYILNVVVILYRWKKSFFYRDWEKGVHYKVWHRYFFETIIALFLVLLLFCIWGYLFSLERFLEHLIWLIAAFISIWALIFVGIEIYFQKRWKKEFEYRSEVIKGLFPDFKQKEDDPDKEVKRIKQEIKKLCYPDPPNEIEMERGNSTTP